VALYECEPRDPPDECRPLLWTPGAGPLESVRGWLLVFRYMFGYITVSAA